MFFDTFEQIKRMNNAGFSQKQSEAVVGTMGDLIKEKFVTKEDLSRESSRVNRRFDQIDHKFDLVDRRFDQIDLRFEQIDLKFDQIDLKFKNLYKSLVLSLGSLILAAPGIYKVGEIILEKLFHV